MKKMIMYALCLSLSMISTVSESSVNAVGLNKTEEVKILGESMTFSTNIDDDFIICESFTEKGEKNVFVYDRKNKTATLNGKDINLKFEQFVDTNLVESNLQYATGAYTPIYMTTQSISFDEVVNSISVIATVIGGVIAVASLTGLVLPSIAGVISNWAGAVGLGSLTAGYYCSGNFSYKLYRTKDPVQFGEASWPQIAYRYQDSKVNFTVKNKTMYHSYNQIGSWWYGSKPF